MPSETLNLILGALIAIVSSSVTVFLTHILQMRRDRAAHARELERQERTKKLDLLGQELDRAESIADELEKRNQLMHSAILAFSGAATLPDGYIDFYASELASLASLNRVDLDTVHSTIRTATLRDPRITDKFTSMLEGLAKHAALHEWVLEQAFRNEERIRAEELVTRSQRIWGEILSAYGSLLNELKLIRQGT